VELRGSVLIFIRPLLLSKNSLKGNWEKAFFFLQWNTNEVCLWQNVQAVLFHAMKANDDLSYNFRRLLKYCPF